MPVRDLHQDPKSDPAGGERRRVMTAIPSSTRRDFLKVSFLAGSGLLLTIYLPGCAPRPTATTIATDPTLPTLEGPDELQPGVFVRIGLDGIVTITVHRSEMGQGVRTALPMILAEELDADWQDVRIEQADADSDYGDQLTGGSVSVERFYMPLRKAGAVARDLLVAAAAQVWGIPKETCLTERGEVVRADTQERLSYGYLVPLAATLPVPAVSAVALKKPSEFRIIGTRAPRVDGPQLIRGESVFGMDVRRAGMLYAVAARSPAINGRVTDFDGGQAQAVPGVRAIVPMEGGVAVVAENTWSALEGRRALEITADEGPASGFNSRVYEESLLSRLTVEPGPRELVRYYSVPFYSHASMEPMNCLVDARADLCEVWAPTQNPQGLKQAIVRHTRLPAEAVIVHVPLIGGGFGRRLDDLYPMPFILEGIDISLAVGAPVRFMGTRQEEFQHDYFHPLSVSRVRANLDNVSLPDVTRLEATGVPTGAWRSVTNVPEAFARESFVDEYAVALGQDPLELRRSLWRGSSRAKAVMDLAAEHAGWGEKLPEGRGRGLAYHATWDATHVAQVAEVSVSGEGQVRVHRVVCAVDCGVVINPDIVEAQMEGGIVFGMTAALKAAISIDHGQVQQTTFHDYPLLRLDETPDIEVHIAPSAESPTGVGEMANPVIAPAIANAVFAATGKRVRRLPLFAEDVRQA
jgi:isoquinoline 1-oxidoreductase subunit beta